MLIIKTLAYNWKAHPLTLAFESWREALRIKSLPVFYITPQILQMTCFRCSGYSTGHSLPWTNLEMTQLFGWDYAAGRFLLLNVSCLDSTKCELQHEGFTSSQQSVFLAVGLTSFLPRHHRKEQSRKMFSLQQAKPSFRGEFMTKNKFYDFPLSIPIPG